jgi:hypothetical protein
MSGFRKRDKASDVFNNTKFVFGPKGNIAQAFPSIERITVDVDEEGEGVQEWSRIRYYSDNSIGEYIDCSNPLCYNGGFRIWDVIRSMVGKGETEFSDSRHCQGYEGSPKGRRKYGSCDNRFRFTVKITYKK